MKKKYEIINKFIKENLKWIVLFACIAIVLLIIENVMDKDIMAFDERGYFLVQKYLISDSITPIAKCITNFANAYWLIGLSVFLLIVLILLLIHLRAFSGLLSRRRRRGPWRRRRRCS